MANLIDLSIVTFPYFLLTQKVSRLLLLPGTFNVAKVPIFEVYAVEPYLRNSLGGSDGSLLAQLIDVF
jgi:hypothetical protein